MHPSFAEEYRAQIEDGPFSETALFLPDRADEAPVRMIYDEQFVELDPDTNVPVLSTAPAFKVFFGSLPARLFSAAGVIGAGTPVRIRGRDFRVSEFRPDGLGGVLIRLHEKK